jgi:hypothetical protein
MSMSEKKSLCAERNITLSMPMLLAALLLVAACEEGDFEDQPLDDLGASEQAVQYEYDSEFQYDFNLDHQNQIVSIHTPVLEYEGGPQKKVGNLSGFKSLIPVEVRCGATFVTPHHAITAAHCVGENYASSVGGYVDGSQMVVKRHVLWDIDPDDLEDARTIYTTGYFEYPYWAPKKVLAGTDGYYVREYDNCEVIERCDTRFGDIIGTCRKGWLGDSFNNVDIALIYCPDRPSYSSYTRVSHGDEGTDEVEMLWVHEVVEDMPLFDPGAGGSDDELDRFEHYTEKAGYADENYHYLGDWSYLAWSFWTHEWVEVEKKKQLFPLISRPWPDGTPRRRIGAPGDVETWTDLFGCHGSSGAGVFNVDDYGRLRLAGPVNHARPNNNAWTDRLCANTSATDYRAGVEILSHANLEYTQALADRAYIEEGRDTQFYFWGYRHMR